MIPLKLSEIAALSGGTLVQATDDQILIHGVETDTRKLTEGVLFVPLSGERFNGLAFVADALQQGAACAFWPSSEPLPAVNGPIILVTDPLEALQQLAANYLRTQQVKVIGVTGSNGKTTTKDMIAGLLQAKYRVHKTNGNYNNHIGLPLTIMQMPSATEIIVLEMGMSGRGEIELLSRIAQPDVAVVTNIGDAHLLQLGSREEIARAKLEILSSLQAAGLFVYNGDEPLITQVLGEPATVQPGGMQHARFGFLDTNDEYATGLMLNARGTTFTTSSNTEQSYFIPLLGRHNVANAMAAMAVARYFGIGEPEIRAQLRAIEVTGMRTEVLQGTTGLTIINDAYNASPTAVRAALQLFDQMTGYRQKVAVLGDMLELGPEEIQLHRSIGHEFADKQIDYLYTYGKLAREIAASASDYIQPERVRAFDDKEQLAQELLLQLTPRDIVMVKGSRGMKLEEVVRVLHNTAI